MIRWFRATVLPWIWLGTRLCLGAGRTTILRTVLLGGACSIAVFLMLAAMAAPVVSDAQRERGYARTPVVDDQLSSGLRMTVIHDAVDSRPLLRMAVADVAPDSPRPPGLAAFPRPGEIVTSPALAQLIASDPAARQRFPQRNSGTVGPEGLIAPDELLAYVGVQDSQLANDQGVVIGYRDASNGKFQASAGATELERLLTPSRIVSAGLALFLLLPLCVLLAICVRFDASRRDRRLAALRLVGASRRQAHFSAAVEMSLIAAVGVGMGLALFTGVARFSEGWRIGRFYWYASDLHIPVIRVVLLAVLVIALAVAVSAAGSRPAVRSPIRIRRSGKQSGFSYLRLVALLVAPVALLVARSALLTPYLRLISVGLGMVASVIVLATVTPLILSSVGALVSKFRTLPVWAVLAARRATHSPAITPKLVTSVLVATYVAGFGMMIGTSVRDGARGPLASGSADRNSPTAEAFGVSRVVRNDLRLSDSVAGISIIERSVATSPDDSEHAIVVRASCRDLGQLFEHVESCTNHRSYRVVHADDDRDVADRLVTGEKLTVQTPRRKGERIEVPADHLNTSGEDYGCQCDIVITTAPTWGDLIIRVAGDVEAFWRDAARLAPGIRFQGALRQDRGFDADAVLTLIYIGLTLTIALTFIAFVIASIDRGVEARRKDAPLLAIGVPVGVLRRAEAAQLLLVIVSGMALSIGLLALTTVSWADVFSMSLVAVVEPLLPLFASVIGGTLLLIVAVMALTTRSRPLAPEDLRRE